MFINVKEHDNVIYFSSLEEKLKKSNQWGLISEKKMNNLISGKITGMKSILYKGREVDVETVCDVIGYISYKTKPGCINPVYETVVIEINGETNKINPAYLKQMQSKDFNLNTFNEENDGIA